VEVWQLIGVIMAFPKPESYLIPVRVKKKGSYAKFYLQIGVKKNHLFFKEDVRGGKEEDLFMTSAYLLGGGGPGTKTFANIVNEINASRKRKYEIVKSQDIIGRIN
jgi:hypothetical protein